MPRDVAFKSHWNQIQANRQLLQRWSSWEATHSLLYLQNLTKLRTAAVWEAKLVELFQFHCSLSRDVNAAGQPVLWLRRLDHIVVQGYLRESQKNIQRMTNEAAD